MISKGEGEQTGLHPTAPTAIAPGPNSLLPKGEFKTLVYQHYALNFVCLFQGVVGPGLETGIGTVLYKAYPHHC